MLDSLRGTQSELDRVAQTTEAQYHVAKAQQQDRGVWFEFSNGRWID
jgi:predicted RNA-binding protein YlxR (DUF448 family)